MSSEQANTQTQFEETQASLAASASEVDQQDSETASKSDTPSMAPYDMTSQPSPFEESLKYRGDFAVDSRNESHSVNYWTGEPDVPTAFTEDDSPIAVEQHLVPGAGPSDTPPMTQTMGDSYVEDSRKYDLSTLQDHQQRMKKINQETLPEGSGTVAYSDLSDTDNSPVEFQQEEEQTSLPATASQDGNPSRRDIGSLWRRLARKATESAKSTAEKEEEKHPTDLSVSAAK